jgi:purine-binding chemotaxis protein CheW
VTGPRGRALGGRRAVDWEAVRARLASIGSHGEAGEVSSARATLERRARELARPLGSSNGEERLEVVTFSLAGETYAVESHAVVAVFKLTDMAPLPGAQAPVRGLASWRGQLLTIVDLREALGLEPASLNDLAHVVVVGGRAAAFGVLVDAVHDVRTLPAAAARPPAAGTSKRLLWRGVTADALVVLDTAALLNLGVES